MKLKIEDWVVNNKFSENINLLFGDATICYKAGANRASLLFSYLGFLTILKERMLGANVPALFPPGQWNDILHKLRNEDEWEKAIFEATQVRERYTQGTNVKEKDAIFAINENLRLQIHFWKDRRNDCAHFKHNAIEGHHVESFWSFIQSNLPKITVEGGMQTLINKIRDHFNPILTAPEKEYDQLVKEIETSIDAYKLGEFWETFLKLDEFEFDMGTSRKLIVAKSFEINSPKTNEALLEILNSNKSLRRSFLNSHPEKIVYLNLNEQEVRKFWQIEIHDMYNPLKTYVALLRNNLIPDAEIPDAHEAMVLKLKSYEVEPHEHHVLLVGNFFDAVKKKIFNNQKFEEFLWVNGRADLIAGIIKNYPAEKDTIARLCYIYGLDTNSNWLLERFANIFTPDAALTTEYKSVIAQHGIEVPAKLEKYFG